MTGPGGQPSAVSGLRRLCLVLLPSGREKRLGDCVTTVFLMASLYLVVQRYHLLDADNQIDAEHTEFSPRPITTRPGSTATQPQLPFELDEPSHVESVLRGTASWPEGKTELHFRPGSLPGMSNAEAFSKCYTDPQKYKMHLGGDSFFGAYSDTQKLIYFHIPKSGSSTARAVMKTAFAAIERSASVTDLYNGKYKDYTKISFVRPPLDRFMSSYDEVFIRHAPWERSRRVPPEFDVFGKGLKSYDDYQNTFCPPDLHIDKLDCRDGPTHENGTLVDGFEKFVWAYDGLRAFDVHLTLQAGLLSTASNGLPLQLDILLNTSRAKEGWKQVGKQHGIDDMTKHLIHGRGYPRRFNVTAVKDKTRRRICRLVALDYCCMNFVLPPVCSNNDLAGVFCNVTQRTIKGQSGKRLSIEPFIHLPTGREE